MAWQKARIEIPTEYGPEERKAIAQEVLDFIVDRTRQKGLNKNNRPFPGYSKSYKESLDFKIGGKTSRVNLTLSGDMLASMELLSHTSGSLLIGFENETKENAKAEGNIRGTYGNRSPIPGKKRDFLGITKGDLRDILKKYPLRDLEARKERAKSIKKLADTAEALAQGASIDRPIKET